MRPLDEYTVAELLKEFPEGFTISPGVTLCKIVSATSRFAALAMRHPVAPLNGGYLVVEMVDFPPPAPEPVDIGLVRSDLDRMEIVCQCSRESHLQEAPPGTPLTDPRVTLEGAQESDGTTRYHGTCRACGQVYVGLGVDV